MVPAGLARGRADNYREAVARARSLKARRPTNPTPNTCSIGLGTATDDVEDEHQACHGLDLEDDAPITNAFAPGVVDTMKEMVITREGIACEFEKSFIDAP